ncbi:MAG: glycosyltransferase [Verrucomicrobiota bacterium]
MTEQLIDLTVVVPARNEERLLPATLAALGDAGSSQSFSMEMIVVDNASSDGTAKVARAGGARVVFEPMAQIARARNAGAAGGTGKWFLFVDADTLVSKETLHQAVEALRSGTVCVGGAAIEGDGEWRGFAKFLVWFWGRVSRWMKLPAGSFFFCTREGFEAVGGFEEGVYAGEEVWFARRLKKWGKARGQGFHQIEDPPVVTSVRKGEMVSSFGLALQFVLLVTCPWIARIRAFCWVWDRSPEVLTKNQEEAFER